MGFNVKHPAGDSVNFDDGAIYDFLPGGVLKVTDSKTKTVSYLSPTAWEVLTASSGHEPGPIAQTSKDVASPAYEEANPYGDVEDLF